MGRQRAGLVATAAVLVLVAGGRARAGELWRGAPDSGDCRLELTNELGGVRIAASSSDAPVMVVSGAPELGIEAAAGAGHPVLSTVLSGSPGGPAGDLEVSVPPGCDVEVRTTDGGVNLEVGEAAFGAAVETVTGDITAWVDPDTDATIAFATSGEITTDFSVEIELRYHSEPAKHGWVTLGTDEPSDDRSRIVQLISRRGAVRLLRPGPDVLDHRAEETDDAASHP